MASTSSSTWRRSFNRFVPLGVVVIGLLLILSNFTVVDITPDFFIRVGVGVGLVMAGFLYGTNPFLTSERKYSALRGEVDSFIGLVRELNRTAIAIGGGPEFDEVTQAMRESLARMEELAGKEA